MTLEKGIASLVEEFIAAGRHHRENRVLMTGETAISPAPFSQGKQKRGCRLKTSRSMA